MSLTYEYKQKAAGYSQSRNISVRCDHNIFQSSDSFRSFHNDLYRSKQKIDSSVNNEAQREDHRRLKDRSRSVDCARDGVRPQFVVRRGNGKPNQIGKHDGEKRQKSPELKMQFMLPQRHSNRSKPSGRRRAENAADSSDFKSEYIFMSTTFPFLMALLLSVPSYEKPAFSRTRQEATLNANGSA